MGTNKSIEKQMLKHKEKMDQMAVEYKRLQKLHREEEVKEQEKRAIKLGMLMQRLIPDIALLDEAHVGKFLERTVANDFGKRALSTILAEQARATTAEDKPAPAKVNDTKMIKPAVPVQQQNPNHVEEVDYS